MRDHRVHSAPMAMRATVFGVFDDEQLADQAVCALSQARFGDGQVQVASGDRQSAADMAGFAGTAVTEHEAKFYQDEFDAGRTIVTVAAGNRSHEAKAILRRHGSYDMLSGILSQSRMCQE